MSDLTEKSFSDFLSHLEKDAALFPAARDSAEKYHLLREKLIRTLIWNKCPESHADAIADTALDRVAQKIAAGEDVRKTASYALTVLRFVWLEHIRKNKELAVGDDAMPDIPVNPQTPNDEDERERCLRTCLARLDGESGPKETRNATLILNYYSAEADEKLYKQRKLLALTMGFPMTVADYRIEEAGKNESAKPSSQVEDALRELESAIDRFSPDSRRAEILRIAIAGVSDDVQSPVTIRQRVEAEFDDGNALTRAIAALETAVGLIQKKSMTRLKVRACRLRSELEKCINRCVEKIASVTKKRENVTGVGGGGE